MAPVLSLNIHSVKTDELLFFTFGLTWKLLNLFSSSMASPVDFIETLKL